MKTAQQYREVIERLAPTHLYPPVDVVTENGNVWLVCAQGHRWGTDAAEPSCYRCEENARYRAKGRPECIVEGCHDVVTCTDAGWAKGIRKCRTHWQEDEGLVYETGPVCLDEMVSVLGVYHPNLRWNGWLCPSIDAWSVMKVMDALTVEESDSQHRYEWLDDGVFKFVEIHDDEEYVELLKPDEDGLYDLGCYSWTWSKDPEFYWSAERKAWAADRTRIWVDTSNAVNQRQHDEGTWTGDDTERRAAAEAAVAEYDRTHPEPEA